MNHSYNSSFYLERLNIIANSTPTSNVDIATNIVENYYHDDYAIKHDTLFDSESKMSSSIDVIK